MTRSQLVQALRRAGVPAGSVWVQGVDDAFLFDNTHYLEQDGDRWVWGFAERGHKDPLSEHATEQEACDTLLAHLRRTVRLVPPASWDAR